MSRPSLALTKPARYTGSMLKLKPVARLYHQFGLSIEGLRLGSDEIAVALEAHGYIILVEYGPNGLPTKYRETDKMRLIPKGEFPTPIIEAIKAHFHIK